MAGPDTESGAAAVGDVDPGIAAPDLIRINTPIELWLQVLFRLAACETTGMARVR